MDVLRVQRRTTSQVKQATILYTKLASVALSDELRYGVHDISYLQSHPTLLVSFC